MERNLIIGGILTLIFLLLIVGAPTKPFRFVGRLVVKIVVGALLLFAVNIVGTQFNFHLPINAGTTFVSGFLGLPGIGALIVIKLYILPS
ncbi:inhibitor of the pro-sigma K processing machinery [Bacillus sp. 491mf]|uniref:pro-sigmaK processing inhibitor BofA family protein n=1 Tax=Bacillus TaxID=1386 RepID=UPI000551A460|nr:MULTISPECIES: pro-sigmaK processing inhibitor BofA family protein [unclassified Bacillus (in: firmicutes)]SFD62451.1 inhibitor of the pro-sigma K processing machinery [Bacillus sp. 491mf]